MESCLTNTLLMIKPVQFRYNAQTAVNNHFQENNIQSEEAQTKALMEFEKFVETLRDNGVEVIVILDTDEHDTPDSIFPNNWISFHQDGKVGIYPMFAENRRLERRDDIYELLAFQGYKIKQKIDLTHWESKKKYLEGTGSLVLDRLNRVAYAAISDRTDAEVATDFAQQFGYEVVHFTALQDTPDGSLPIYHTNVMMCIGDDFALICLDAIDDEGEKNEVILSLTTGGKEIIELTEKQIASFAGNALQVINHKGEKLLVMSSQAKASLTDEQVTELTKYNDRIVSSSLETIETLGGGSARCMMAEVFLNKS